MVADLHLPRRPEASTAASPRPVRTQPLPTPATTPRSRPAPPLPMASRAPGPATTPTRPVSPSTAPPVAKSKDTGSGPSRWRQPLAAASGLSLRGADVIDQDPSATPGVLRNGARLRRAPQRPDL